MPAPPPATVARFRAHLEALTGRVERPIAVAVSGGPDSLALLLLSAAAFPGQTRAASVDHGLRPESAAEVGFVADISAGIGIPHAGLRAEWAGGLPKSGIQEAAREARYAALLRWCADQRIDTLLTAHHADDQAETLLMRLGRGAGLPGLLGIRAVQPMAGCRVVRPLLGWRRSELAEICVNAGLTPIDDPSNGDPRHERSRVRKLLAASDAFDAGKVAESADHLLEVDEAVDWLVDEVVRTRIEVAQGTTFFDAAGLPREVRRRALARLLPESRGSAVARAIERLDNGQPTTLAGVRLTPGRRWSLVSAPPRRAN